MCVFRKALFYFYKPYYNLKKKLIFIYLIVEFGDREKIYKYYFFKCLILKYSNNNLHSTFMTNKINNLILFRNFIY